MIDWDKAGLFGIPVTVLGLLAALSGLAGSIDWALAFLLVALYALPVVAAFAAWMERVGDLPGEGRHSDGLAAELIDRCDLRILDDPPEAG
jgi:hypothetical protein